MKKKKNSTGKKWIVDRCERVSGTHAYHKRTPRPLARYRGQEGPEWINCRGLLRLSVGAVGIG